jgi:hypothetical protein
MSTPTLQLTHRAEEGEHRVDVVLEGAGPRQAASARFAFGLGAQEREDVRWYLEEYLQYPVEPAPTIAARVERRLAELGVELFTEVFEANRDTIRLWNAVSSRLPEARVEVVTGVEEALALPWELLRDPIPDAVLALRARSFVRSHPEAAQTPALPGDGAATIRVLLVICRPGGGGDVPFRSVASHLVRLSRAARERFQLDVLRPPTFAHLARVLDGAKRAGTPYHVVHFDGHGAYLDQAQLAALEERADALGRADPLLFSVLSPPRGGSHGYLVFEDPDDRANQQLVDGPALGRLLADGGVPVLVLNACRSAHAALVSSPEQGAEGDAHRRVRAYGSLAHEVADAGVAGVVAMRYNVYVITAASFVGELYAALLEGQELGGAVSAGRKQLAAQPYRQISLDPRPLQDWLVPLVYEAAPLSLFARPEGGEHLGITLSQAEAAPERARLDPTLPADPDVGFFGRDETLLALERAFDGDPIVLLHAWAGSGKTATAVEFARWYALTGGVPEGAVLFTSFTRHTPLARVLDQVGETFAQALEAIDVHWYALEDPQRRALALQVLEQVPVLWIWDNVEPVAGFPAGTASEWSVAEQEKLARFLGDARQTQAKFLLTSRRDERAWLGELPSAVELPPMPELERVELARALVAKRGRRLTEVEDWRPLLAFTQGNPLTATVLVGQALREGLRTRAELEGFVARLRAGAAAISDDIAQGRTKSLGASLGYGFERAFSESERRRLALLHLFQGFVDVDALAWMGRPESEFSLPELGGLGREEWIAILERAAEIGLLTPYGGGYYVIHPALPWYFQTLFAQHYDLEEAGRATRAYTEAIANLGNYWHNQYVEGEAEVVAVLAHEEENLLQARALARDGGWWNAAIGAMQGLRSLYEHSGRGAEWARLVDELVPDLVDPASDRPLPGREEEWRFLTQYRANLAFEARDWQAAERLERARAASNRERAAGALAKAPEALDDEEQQRIRSLAASLHELGRALAAQGEPECLVHYQEATSLAQRIGAHQAEATVAFNLGNAYSSDVPSLYDLDQADRWYRRDLELRAEGHGLGRARTIGQLGSVAYRRFLGARDAGAPDGELLDHLTAAAAAYREALELLPPNAVPDLAVAHNQLGVVYVDAGDLDTALGHYRESIRYEEQAGNLYGAGQTRYNVALALAQAGRLEDARLYAQAALRDFESLGAGAAATVDKTRDLIASLEHDPRADEHSSE